VTIFTFQFLGALGRWQRGWGQDPTKRASIARALVEEATKLPDRFRIHDGSALYRKRHLYRSKDQRELAPLFLSGVLDEGSPTSWSKDRSFAEKFDQVFDDLDPASVAGAIFKHVPVAGEVILNIPALWEDSDFLLAVDEYKNANGAEARGISHFRGERDQNEIIVHAPLRAVEICKLSRSTTFDNICAAMGAADDSSKGVVRYLLKIANINPPEPRFLPEGGSRRVVERVIALQREKIEAWFDLRVPTRPRGSRGRLKDAYELGKQAAEPGAKFEGWRRLRGRGGLMEARWSDGTVAYHGFWRRIWLY